MKFKKMLTVLFTSVLILTFSSPANAAKGIADTRDKAISFFPGDYMQLFISNSKDEDWYVYTNNSGKPGYFFAFLNPEDDEKNFRFGFQIDYGNENMSHMAYADPFWSSQTIGSFYIPAGGKVYFVVKKLNDVVSQYAMGLSAP